MTARTYHRGAVVSARPSDIPVWTDARLQRMFRGQQYQMETYGGLTARRLAAVAKPSRQRRKGPIVRYGAKR